MTEPLFAAYLFSLGLTCFTVYLCFRGIAWVIRHGWRSMLGLVAVRAEAVIEWQDCDVKSGGDWDVHVDSALEVLLTHEAGVPDGATPEQWIVLEEEFADLDPLAAQLGERAS